MGRQNYKWIKSSMDEYAETSPVYEKYEQTDR